jgi:hypothetical protein
MGFGLNAGEQLQEQRLGAKLIAEKSRAIARLAIEGGGKI